MQTKSDIIDTLYQLSQDNRMFALINLILDNSNILTDSRTITSEEIDDVYAQWYSEREGYK